MTVPGAPAARRLRRTRLGMTMLFTGTTAVCLLLLAILAAQLDATSRAAQLDADVSARAGGLARAVYVDQGVLHLEPLTQDELAVGATAVAVYRLDASFAFAGTAYRSGDGQDQLPPEGRRRLIATLVEEQATVHDGFAAQGGQDVAWAAAPVWDGDRIAAVVVVGQSTATQTAAHTRLLWGLAAGCAVLLIAACAAGYLLSGRAMRPAADALLRQEQFLAEAAHELRTPLARVRLLLDSPDPGDRSRASAVIDRIGHLLGALMLRARVDAGSYELERTRLRLDQLVQHTVEEFAGETTVDIAAEPVITLGDPVLITHALRNLLDNAAQHAPGAAVHIVVVPGCVTVADQGPGIPVPRRAAAVHRGVGTGEGTGAGLAIAAWVAQVHGGSLSLDGAAGGGLTVRLHLPAG